MPIKFTRDGGIERYMARLDKEIPQILVEEAARCVQQAQAAAPYKTGALRRQIQMRVVSKVHVIVGVIAGPASSYARIQDKGGTTSPHVIEPRRKKALNWPGAKHPVRRVQHPGSRIPGNHYFTQAVVDTVQRMRMRFRAALKP